MKNSNKINYSSRAASCLYLPAMKTRDPREVKPNKAREFLKNTQLLVGQYPCSVSKSSIDWKIVKNSC